MTNTTGTAFSISPTADVNPVNGALPDGTSITVTFNPSAEVNYAATIRHSGAGLTSPVEITLTGAGILPAITIQAGTPTKTTITELAFGSLSTAADAITQEYTVTGKGLVGNLILALTGDGNAAYTISSTTLTPGEDGTLPDGATITVTFDPTAEQDYPAIIHTRRCRID